MDESTSARNSEPAGWQAAGRVSDPSPAAALHTKPRDPHKAQVRRILPWVVTAAAVLVAGIAIAALLIDDASEPTPVAQLAPQTDSAQGTIPLDDEIARNWGVTEADFVSHGSYGDLQIWSTTAPEAKRCLAVVVENRISVFNCAAPTLDTIADFDIDPNLVPPAPSGEPAANVRFVLHDEIVDVYLAPNPEGGFF
ncbi:MULTISPECIES: hypothetical protein [unclassified Microbacterium]|uniref:hypothetical protein n=1 Tax=unclassified Microbacterium TaxID=2609290 RepID=UPI00214C9148|nr:MULTISPECIES: hypothetical protein [unclassified Microbacterium]MCR2784009.1 hypothetical protein [Microbacterium sp. zg.B96]WIM15149.1 hypothetical protein QNO11_11415 [Microbacterium sp. zg-B96]